MKVDPPYFLNWNYYEHGPATQELMQLLKEIKGAHEKLPVSKRTNRRIPLLLKISPDLEEGS